MPSHDFDLFVIGGGSGGVRCARTAAALGARVALVEASRMGGTCVNLGCVPKKLFSYGAQFADHFEDAAGYGYDVGDVRFDWAAMVASKDREIERLNGIYERLLDRAGVEILRGRGVVRGPHEVEVDGRRHTARNIVVATGGWPWLPDFQGREHVITSNEVFSLERFPERVVVAGGGYIAAEFASIFRGFGSEVSLVYRGELFLRGFDLDARRELANEMRKRGVKLHFHCIFERVERVGDEVVVHLSDGDRIEADLALFATGRRPNTQGLGLEDVGVKLTDRGAVVVDEHYRSSVNSIYAIGDVIDRIQLTPVALEEGTVLARNLFGEADQRVDYTDVPTAVFTTPNLAAVGLTEEEARERTEVRIYKSLFRPMKHTMSGRDERTFMKLVVDDLTDRVLGCHMVGSDAGELIQGLAVALKCGATKAQFDATIGIHPTAAEEFVTMRDPVVEVPPAP